MFSCITFQMPQKWDTEQHLTLYLRLVDDKGRIHCGLAMAKSRVAPLKTVTIPRMELTATVVSAQLHKYITE